MTAPAGLRASWAAPALDPRLLIAIVLIFAELMLVTAVALFFSTFSSPLLATLLTLGLWVAGHFNGDLRNFERGRRFGARHLAGARRSITCCRTWRRSTSRPKWCTASPVAARHVAYTLAYAACLHRRPADGGDRDLRPRDFK